METVSVEVISDPSEELFKRAYEKKRKPVVIKNALDNWPAINKWSTQYFREKSGDLQIPLRVKPSSTPQGYFGGIPDEKISFSKMTMNQYLDYLDSHKSQEVYLSGLSVPDYLPELETDIPILKYMDPRKSTKKQLWIGNKGTIAALHLDIWDNFLCQISGKKRFVLFDYRDKDCIYPHSSFSLAPHISKINVDTVDLDKYPNFKKLIPYEAIVNPGDALFLPAGWWHQVWTLSNSISVNFWWFRNKTAIEPWFLRYYPFLIRHHKRHQRVQGREKSNREVAHA